MAVGRNRRLARGGKKSGTKLMELLAESGEGIASPPPPRRRAKSSAGVVEASPSPAIPPHVLRQLMDNLRANGFKLQPGMTDTEKEQLEERFQIRFPPDLLCFLQCRIPTGGLFTPWRDMLSEEPPYRDLNERFLERVIEDVEIDRGWHHEWGPRPQGEKERVQLAKEMIKENPPPKLIPIYGHRCMCSEPHVSGQAVLSIFGTDVIIFGDDLVRWVNAEFQLDYLTKEFGRGLNVKAKKLSETGEVVLPPFWGAWVGVHALRLELEGPVFFPGSRMQYLLGGSDDEGEGMGDMDFDRTIGDWRRFLEEMGHVF